MRNSSYIHTKYENMERLYFYPIFEQSKGIFKKVFFPIAVKGEFK
jgi:hypothetical protein